MMSSPFLSTVLDYQKAYAEKRSSFQPIWLNQPFVGTLSRMTRKKIPARASLDHLNQSRWVVMYSGGLWSTILLSRHLVLGHQVKVVHINQPGRKQDIHGAWRMANDQDTILEQESDRLLSTDLRTIKRGSAELEYFEVDVPDAFVVDELRPAVIYAVGCLFGLRVTTAFTFKDIPGWVTGALNTSAKEFYGQDVRFGSLTQHATPASMLLDYVECGGRAETLKSLMACSAPVMDEHCGVCWGCYKRYRAFHDVGWTAEFNTPPWDGPEAHRHEKRWVEGAGRLAL